MIPDDELLEAILKHDEPVVAIYDLEPLFDVTDTTINNRLNSLYERGFIEKKPCGSGVVWWVPERITPQARRELRD